MATSGIGFRWLDILEKEFDKACVELNTSLLQLETEEPEVVFGARQKIATLSSCFAQLTHKALTIFQNNAKLEAELVDLRAELVQSRADSNASAGQDLDGSDSAGLMYEVALARAEAAQFARENAKLRECMLGLHSELFGARLATKYLDKELAGRIQQLQLLGRDMRDDVRDSLWAQVESEILVQRHKTLARVCRGAAALAAADGRVSRPRAAARRRPRVVRVPRPHHHGLGLSVTGGREHGVPILISELEAEGPAARTRQLHVGDAILAIDDRDLTQVCHAEAVCALQAVRGDCSLRVQYVASDHDDDNVSLDNYRFPLYWSGSEAEAEADGGGATPTAPRTPDYNNHRQQSPDDNRVEEITNAVANLSYANNNPAILDMDDDGIQITSGGYRALPVASPQRPPAAAASPPPARPAPAAATPVHRRRRRRDWRTRGAYRLAHSHSSDDDTPNDPDPDLLPATEPKETDDEKPPIPFPPPKEVQQPKLKSKLTLPSQRNGHERKAKPFRIGSAKRVSEVVLPLNGNVNGEKETLKYPMHLVTGDGDPDFGTPV